MSDESTMNPNEWGSIAFVASNWHMSEKTVRRRIAEGIFEARRFGPRLIRVRLSSIEDSARALGYQGDWHDGE